MAKPKEGDTRGWSPARKHPSGKVQGASGYRYEKGRWVQYKDGKRHGVFKGRGGITGNVDVVGKAIGLAKNAPTPFNYGRKAISSIKKGAGWVNKKSKESAAKREKLKELKEKNEGVTSKKPVNGKKPVTTEKKSDALKVSKDKAAWIKKTRNSPAAQSGAFTDDERWAQQQKHRAWKASRKKKRK